MDSVVEGLGHFETNYLGNGIVISWSEMVFLVECVQ